MPPLVEDVKACFRNHNRFVSVLRLIVRGLGDQPLKAEVARQMARDVLAECDIGEDIQ
jgi:hypothetical protein